MRVTTAFNRLLQLPGASVATVSFERDGVVVGLRRRARGGWSVRAAAVSVVPAMTGAGAAGAISIWPRPAAIWSASCAVSSARAASGL